MAVLKTGPTPSASGSAYLELEPLPPAAHGDPVRATPKLMCTVHGPRPLPTSAPFASNLVLSTYVKFATFATRQRRGYLRDAVERDLAAHLETALRGVVIAERWPKSGVEVVVTVLEAEEDGHGAFQADAGASESGEEGWAVMPLLAGCITVASTALVDSGIACVDIVSGGVAALVQTYPRTDLQGSRNAANHEVVLDPCPFEHRNIIAMCVVGYLGSRDEVTEYWIRGALATPGNSTSNGANDLERLVQGAIQMAAAAQAVILTALGIKGGDER